MKSTATILSRSSVIHSQCTKTPQVIRSVLEKHTSQYTPVKTISRQFVSRGGRPSVASTMNYDYPSSSTSTITATSAKAVVIEERNRGSPSCRRYMGSSSSTSIPEQITKSLFGNASILRETVKETILNEAIRDDSHLWKYASGSSSSNNNNSTPSVASSSASDKPQQDRSQHHLILNGINGDHHHHHHHHPHLNGSAMNHPTQVDDHSINNSYHLSIDMLSDLYVSEVPKYWPKLSPQITLTSTDTTITDPFVLVQGELQQLAASIRNDLIGTDHPVLNQAASYFFAENNDSGGGKKVRPMMVLLLSRALSETVTTTAISGSTSSESKSTLNGLNDGIQQSSFSSSSSSSSSSMLLSAPIQGYQRSDLPQAQRRLAEISEMIHTASLFHDDVIDGSDTRRNIPTVHTVFGNKMAILAGDYLLARASICLARLRNTDVVETMSTIIEHLVRGEVMQLRGNATSSTTTTTDSSSNSISNPSNDRLQYYLRKNFYKTASLMANSCKSTALLGNYSHELIQASYLYGKHIGMAFQLVDDVLDFEGSLLQMGKPTLSDLKAGLATAPVLFASETFPLEPLIQRKFSNDGDVDTALQYVIQSDGIARTKNLARVHAEYAIQALSVIQPSIYRDALIQLAFKVVSRTK